VEHASALNGQELTRIAWNCTSATWTDSISQVNALRGPNRQIKGHVHTMIVKNIRCDILEAGHRVSLSNDLTP